MIEKPIAKSLIFKIGILLLILACVCWIIALVVPLISLSLHVKATIVTTAIIVGEVLFWLGALMAGKETVAKYKRFFNPRNWGRQKDGN